MPIAATAMPTENQPITRSVLRSLFSSEDSSTSVLISGSVDMGELLLIQSKRLTA
jgi:hypothetical protein